MQEISPEPTTPPPVVIVSQEVAALIFIIAVVLISLLIVYFFYRFLFKAKVGTIDGTHIHTSVMSEILKKTPKVGETKK